MKNLSHTSKRTLLAIVEGFAAGGVLFACTASSAAATCGGLLALVVRMRQRRPENPVTPRDDVDEWASVRTFDDVPVVGTAYMSHKALAACRKLQVTPAMMRTLLRFGTDREQHDCSLAREYKGLGVVMKRVRDGAVIVTVFRRRPGLGASSTLTEPKAGLLTA